MDNDSAGIATDSDPANDYYTFNGNLLLISLGILAAVCLFITLYHSYVRWTHQQRRDGELQLEERRRPPPRADYLVFNLGRTVPATATPHKGLERAVLKSLPTFFYNSAAHVGPPLECAVCLSDFGDNDLIRLLPKCNHCFHILCIDMWFYSHSSCPLCRVPVKPVPNPVKTVTGSGSGLSPACSSSSSSPLPALTGPDFVDLKKVDPGSGDGKVLGDPGGRIGSAK